MADTMALPNGQILAQEAAADSANEPSMEDILASIRRIIASDQGVGAARQLAASRVTPEPTPRQRGTGRDQKVTTIESKELEPVPYPGEIPALTDLDALVFPPAAIGSNLHTDADEAPLRADHRAAHLHEDLFPPATASALIEEEVYDLQPEHLVAKAEAEPLISSTAGASVSSSFQALADTMLLRDPDMFERIARDTLRPMLKAWLDENLPSMVERLVRAEIERVARGGRNRD